MITIDPIKRPPRKSSVIDKDELMKEIDQKFSNLVGDAPETLDTIKEIADALGNNPDILQIINDKANKSEVYTKPSSGIPKTDLEKDVQDSIEKVNLLNVAAVDLGADVDEPDLDYVTNEEFENVEQKLAELGSEVGLLSAEMIIGENLNIPLIADSAFNAHGLALGDNYTIFKPITVNGVASVRLLVNEGEVYRLKGRGNNAHYKGYFVVNTDLEVIQIIGDDVEYDLDLIIGANALYLYVNCVNYNPEVDGVWIIQSESLKDVVLEMRSEGGKGSIVDSIDLNSNIVVGYAYNLGAKSVGDKFTSRLLESATSAYARIAVNPNSKYEVRGKGSPDAFRFFAFLDKNLTILELSTKSYDTRDVALVLTPPSDAATLIVNYSKYDASLDSLVRIDTYDIADSIRSISKPLMGKNIVCFGDSITQSKGSEMGYSDYLSEAGASVINVGIGGTQIKQRKTPSTNPTSSLQAYGGLDMVSLAIAVANNDYTIAEASAAYIKNNNLSSYDQQAVIARLKSIDWSKVNIVTIFGGTNDWNHGNNLGNTSDEGVTSTLGALNLMIKSLLTAYPHLRIYCFTPIVRYVASSIEQRTDETWAGNMKNDEDKTLIDYVDAIKKVAENNCIPVCDMYRTLGWNKYNFSQYFNDNDGTHPYKGFKEIANRMQSFILSNL